MNNLIKNWKTTSAGIGMIVTAGVHLAYSIHAKGLTESDCSTTILAIITGIGLVAAGDAGVTPPPGTT